MTTLGDHFEDNIRRAQVKVIRELHKFIFRKEGDRGNRQRLREFTGFGFEENSEEFKEHGAWAKEEFTVGDLTAICNLLCLDYNGTKDELISKLTKSLNTLQFDHQEEEETEDEEEDEESEGEENRQEDEIPTATSARFQMSFRDVEDTIREFNGSDNYPINTWIREFEETALIFKWTDVQKFIFAKKRINGLAKLFLQGEKNIKSWKMMRAALKQEFALKMNSAKLHEMLMKRKMNKSETIQEYFLVMKELASRGSIEEEAIVQYIIDGIPEEANSKLLLYGATTLKELKKKLEAFHKYREKSTNQPSSNKWSNTTKSTDHRKNARGTNNSGNVEINTRTKKCFNCNESGHFASECTKPKRSTNVCFGCQQPGHLKRDCPKTQQVQQNASTNLIQQKESLIDAYTINVQLEFGEINAVLDTGSPSSFLDVAIVPSNKTIEPYTNTLAFEGINSSRIVILGRFKQNVCVQNTITPINFFVVPSGTIKFQCLLGRDFIANENLDIKFGKQVEISRKDVVNSFDNACVELLNIDVCNENDIHHSNLKISDKIPGNVVKEIHEIIEDHYENPIRPLKPVTDFELELTLKTNAKPFYFNPRRLSYAEKEAVSNILDDLLSRGIIRPSNSQYCSPIVLVRKKNGQYRMAVDYRELNKQLERFNFPIPIIDEQLDSLRDKKYFTKLDIKDAFHHVRLRENSIPFTAFITFKGVYEYTGMPFGLSCGPAAFMRFICLAFGRLLSENKILIYIDDILIATETREENLEILREVLDVFVANCLELRMDKCEFLLEEIQYLGYQIDIHGIRPGTENVLAVTNYPMPTNFKQLHSYLGFISYFRRFIKDFSILAKPLFDLLKQKIDFTWNDELTAIFEKFKNILTSKPVLAIYSPNAVTELHCDASSHGFGAILLQKQADGSFHPVCFYSKRTTSAESRYHSFELETLAIVYALDRFRIYLHGIKFKIVTDCASVKAALERKEINPRILRWSLVLRNFDYELEHRAGSRLRHVDALSRNYTVSIINENSFDRNLALLQDLDPNIKKIKQKLEKQEDKQFDLNNGLVYRKSRGDLLFYVPVSMESNVIRSSHDVMGHQGINKTMEHLSRVYWFPEIKSKVQAYIQNCLKCISYGTITNRVEGTLHIPEKINLPFQTIHIDHYGPLERTGNRHK